MIISPVGYIPNVENILSKSPGDEWNSKDHYPPPSTDKGDSIRYGIWNVFHEKWECDYWGVPIVSFDQDYLNVYASALKIQVSDQLEIKPIG